MFPVSDKLTATKELLFLSLLACGSLSQNE